FSKISASSGIDVYIVQGDKESVTVEADENLLELIVTRVKGDKLIIKTEESIRRAKKLNVYVTLVMVDEISVSSGSDLESRSLIKAGTLDISVSSASSGSDLKASDLKALECKAKASSGGDVSVYAVESIEAHASSGGDVSYYGNGSFADKSTFLPHSGQLTV
ncbi:hypothetical protein ADUPG1_001747, partial [Aduncisulcus paluster]